MDLQVSRNAEDGETQDLKAISMGMKEYLNAENEAVMQTALERINRNPGLLARLFPDAFTKEEQVITLDRMRTLYDKKKQFFELYTNVQLEIARRRGDALVASVGMALQGKLAAFATQRIDELSQTIGESRQKFMARKRPQFEDLETYKDLPALYDPARESINKEITTYFAGIDELLNGFIEALKSKAAP